MQNEEIIPQLEEEKKNEQTEEELIVPDEPSEPNGETTPEGQDTIEAELRKARAEAAKYRRLFEKTQKGTGTQKPNPEVINKSPDISVIQETVLKSQGMDDELLKELKAIAQIRGTDLLTAQNDPLFAASKALHEKKASEKNAGLGASKRSGTSKPVKSIDTPGLSREEHMELWKKMTGQ